MPCLVAGFVSIQTVPTKHSAGAPDSCVASCGSTRTLRHEHRESESDRLIGLAGCQVASRWLPDGHTALPLAKRKIAQAGIAAEIDHGIQSTTKHKSIHPGLS